MREIKLSLNNQEAYVRYSDLPGDKIPIVFIPGWGCSGSFDFTEVASQKGISEHRRIIIDLIGSGYSDSLEDFDYSPESHSSYIKEILDGLGLEDFIIYGHSMGGRIGISLADLYDGRISGMILCEGSMLEEFFPYMDQGEDYFVKTNFLKMMKSLGRYEDQMFFATCRICSPMGLYREAIEMMNPESIKWEKSYFQGKYKKAFIYGEVTDDEGFNLDNIGKENIKLIEVKNAGHTMNWDMPYETSLAILEAINYMGLDK